MNPLYPKLATLAAGLLSDWGRPATLKRYTGAARTLSASGPVAVVILPASKGTVEAFDNRLEDESLRGKTLRYLKIAAKGAPFEPMPLDVLEFDNVAWEVLGCTPVNPAGEPIVYGVGVFKL